MSMNLAAGRGTPLPHALREYSLLADSRRGALIGPRGDVSFMCAPSWHDDAVFSALIGGRGSFTIAPADPWFVWGGYYEERSLIFRSRWVTDRGVVECREALAFPGDAHRAILLRRVLPIDAPARLRVTLDPRAGFGRSSIRGLERTNGVWNGRSGSLRLRFMGAPDASYEPESGLVTEISLGRRQSYDFVVELSDVSLPTELPDADELWAATASAWADVTGDCSESVAPRDAEHAVAILRGLTQPGGGMVAAATTSLPERAEAGRNYDYRYAWIRDQCYAGLAAATLGPHPLVADAIAFVSARLLEDGGALEPAYTIDGEKVPKERNLRGLRGYPGGSDKTGNWVNGQFQLDALGESLQLFAAAAGTGQLSTEARRATDVAVRAIAARWKTPDSGIWELAPDWWTHSRLECIAGLRSIASPGLMIDASQAARCEALADKILAEVGRRCTHPTGRWQRSPTDERVDASLLLPPVRGGLPAGDTRTVGTYRAVHDELGRDGYVYRFRQDGRPLHEAEGAFLLCGFMMSLASLQQGDIIRAIRLFERNRAGCGSPGLFAEEYDVQQRQLRGNLPQAFVHALLLETSMALARAD
ncbi:MAG: glycoside hydrolase family 15 protein [Acidimicrobiales bacterium]